MSVWRRAKQAVPGETSAPAIAFSAPPNIAGLRPALQSSPEEPFEDFCASFPPWPEVAPPVEARPVLTLSELLASPTLHAAINMRHVGELCTVRPAPRAGGASPAPFRTVHERGRDCCASVDARQRQRTQLGAPILVQLPSLHHDGPRRGVPEGRPSCFQSPRPISTSPRRRARTSLGTFRANIALL